MLSAKDFPYEVPELHCHVRSDKDAFMFADKLADRLKEMGMPGIAITDHGVVTSIEDYRHVLQGAGLKVIPGCELYIDGGKILGRQHGIILAIDDAGWHGIMKIVTDSNRTLQGGYPVISSERLKEFGRKYQGHIIFMTACMQGVIASIYLSNNKVAKLVAKAEKKQAKYLSPDSDKYKTALKSVNDLDGQIELLRKQRDEAKRYAEMKFATREKKTSKLTGQEFDDAMALIEKDKEIAVKAQKALPGIKNRLSEAQKQRTKANAVLSPLNTSVKKYQQAQEEIDSLKAETETDAELEKRAEKELMSYVDAFGIENTYAEIQYHGLEDEAVCFPKIAALARRLGVQLVATNDSHMLTNTDDDLLRRCLLRSLRFGEKFEEPSASDRELYIKTTDSRIEWLKKILPEDMVEEALSNAVKIFERCNVEFRTEKHYPIASSNPKQDIERLVNEGIKWRFPDGFPDKEAYEKRIRYELDIIEGMGYDNYFLVVREFLTYGSLLSKVPKDYIPEAPLETEELKQYIHEKGWDGNAGYRIGTGRGSDGGSEVCYLLGITNLDPIKYDLLFERFLNPERVSMPDIDSDISADTRQKVIDHCKYVYGQDSVSGIMSTNAQGPKGAIGIASKFYGLRKYGSSLRNIGDRMSKDIPNNPPDLTFSTQVDRTTGKVDECSQDTETMMQFLYDKWVTNSTDRKQAYDCRVILHWAEVMEGVFTAYGLHAAGVVIVQKGVDVSDVLPLMWSKKLGMMVTQCSKDDVEANGLLKFDFLGLQTLDIITEALQMIQQRTGEAIDVLKLDIADENVYKDIFQTGRTNAVFQFESDGMKNMLKRFHPTEFSDLVLLNAAYRPGPMQYLNDIVEVKNGRKKPEYLTPMLEPILRNTYGAMIYQEQVMQVCQSLAGYSFGGADLVRRAMSKKKKEKLAHEREAFIHGDSERGIKGCVNNGIPEDVANAIFDQMMHFASYAFNKSHAAAYAYNAYITAWLKEYYPAEFFAAALNWAKDQDEIRALLIDASNCGVGIDSPDINVSGRDFCVSGGRIVYALSAIRKIKSTADDIIAERRNGRFISLKDFIYRSGLGSAAVNSLIDAGACDEFCTGRAYMKKQAETYIENGKKYRAKQSLLKSAKTVFEHLNELKTDEDVIKIQEEAGEKVEIKKLMTYEKIEQKIHDTENEIRDIYALEPDDIYVTENAEERLANEKDALGAYVSASPLDFYPSCEDVGVQSVEEGGIDAKTIYGYIEDVVIKKSRTDGSEMAFFMLSDKTGSAACACFGNLYKKYGELISDGAVVKLNGDYRENRNGDGYQFVISGVNRVNVKQDEVYMQVNSYALFHTEKEENFRKKYEDSNGHPFIIWDKATDQFRKMSYNINDAALEEEDIRLINDI